MEIDIVIPWVDGSDPEHIKKRSSYENEYILSDDAIDADENKRWIQHQEIIFMLRSVERFAPWIRKIFIITDEQSPVLSNLTSNFVKKIEVIDHKVVFSENLDILPTFNSATICTGFQNIKELSEHFIIFNDDIFFTSPVCFEDFYKDGKVVLRGEFRPYIAKRDQKNVWQHHKINSAKMAGTLGSKIFHLAHVCQPIQKSFLTQYFHENPDHYHENIRHRFRSKAQFNISSLFANLAIKAEHAHIYSGDPDWHWIPADMVRKVKPFKIRRSVKLFLDPKYKIGCINDIDAVQKIVPRTKKILRKVLSNPDSG